MKYIGLVLFIFSIVGCSDSSDEVDTSASSKFPEFPDLPKSTAETIEITGAMSWWFWEGDGGCFGTLTDGRKNIELHSEADLCEPIEYEEGAKASIQITYDSSKQYVSGKKMYTITRFIK